MRNVIWKLFFFGTILMLFESCQKDSKITPEENGSLQFGFSSTKLKSGAVSNSEDIGAVIISIADESSKVVLQQKKLDLINFNGNFITEPIALPSGKYFLSEFIVVDFNGKAIYASPKKGSEKAYLVNCPLPIEIDIQTDYVTKVVPEVLSVLESNPEEFGYNTFGFNIVETFDFLISALVYNDTTQNFELTNATLQVSADDKVILLRKIDAATNKITLRKNVSKYSLKLVKEGYQDFIKTYSTDSLELFFNSEDKGPLVIILSKQGINTLVLQPGAEEGKDAAPHSYYPDANSGPYELIQSLSWTIGGGLTNLRTFIEFNLSEVPKGSKIISAKLSLYEAHNEKSPTQGHSQLTGSNACYIKRVTSPWEEMAITWNNQPSFTDLNRVVIPAMSDPHQDIIDLDVTKLVQDILDNPESGFGFVIMQQDETPYRTVTFASSDHADASKHPKLVVEYGN